ncbi:MAG TPA: hypothetical protein DCY20_05305 [Firmicutes bacterium]|nr:hypothetical protein [Bacillota bacterium]
MKSQESQQINKKKTVGETLQSICLSKRKRKGLTLLEVVISLALFAILLVPISSFVNSSVQMNKKAEVKQQATLLGQSMLEELGSISELFVGENELFGKENIVIEVCEDEGYCISTFEKDDMLIDIKFDSLEDSSTSNKETLFNINEDSIASKVLSTTQNTGLFIEITNNNITAKIADSLSPSLLIVKEKKGEVGSENLFIEVNNAYFASLKYAQRSSQQLTETLKYNNINIEVKTNNKNQQPITNIYIKNNTSTPITVCANNKLANGHEVVTVIDENKSNGSIETSNIEIQYNNCSFSGGDGSSEEGNEQQPVIPPTQETKTEPLYEIEVNIFSQTNELIFSGKRVLPLKFDEE